MEILQGLSNTGRSCLGIIRASCNENDIAITNLPPTAQNFYRMISL
jgi:hypothetical protein